jgi:hypothetical protein
MSTTWLCLLCGASTSSTSRWYGSVIHDPGAALASLDRRLYLSAQSARLSRSGGFSAAATLGSSSDAGGNEAIADGT